MQNYIDFANKNGIVLLEKGKCQFCGANVSDGIKECVDIFNTEFDSSLDFYNPENLIYYEYPYIYPIIIIFEIKIEVCH